MKSSSFIFKENPVLIEEDNPSVRVVRIEEELDAVEVDGIRNLGNLPGLMFID